MRIWTVDAFADQPFTGNPAAVTIVEEFPSDLFCLKIAAEMNLSETAFIKPLGQDIFHIRWFTPKVEVELCGHATLASAHVLFQEHQVKGEKIRFESKSGPLYVVNESDGLALDFPLQKPKEAISLAPFQNLFGTVQLREGRKFANDAIVVFEKEDDVRRLNPDFNKLSSLAYRGVLVTAKGNPPYDFVSRCFFPKDGLGEDPVTGSAHCKLAPYWCEILGKDKFSAFQASARGGKLDLAMCGDRLKIKGQAITILEGNLKVWAD